MLTKEDILQIAEIIATANGHPAPGGYSAMVGDVFDRLTAAPTAVTPLIGTQVLTDPAEWPQLPTDTGPVVETKVYADGSSATGPAPLPLLSPDEQEAAEKIEGPVANTDIAV